MKKIIFVLILNSQFLILNSFAQSPNWLWAKSMGGTVGDAGRSIAIDASGNVYTTGFFSGTVDFNPNAGVFNLISAGNVDIFISKLDVSGNFIWAKGIGGTGNDVGSSIVVDASGNIYTSGAFYGTADFDPGAGTFNLTSVGSGDIFISKLDSSGNFIWAKAMGGTVNASNHSMALDSFGNIYSTGNFSGTVDFNPGLGVFALTSAGNADIFISKLDSAGNFIWAKAMGGIDNDYNSYIALDASGNIYTTGIFWGTSDFDPGAGTFNLTSAGIDDIVISKLDNAGNFLWAKRMGGTGYDGGESTVFDLTGNGFIYTTGFFQGTVDFNPGLGVYSLTSAGSNDIFISKLDIAGNFVWAKAMGGTNSDVAYSITLDAAGNVYTSGHFSATTDFDPGAGVFNYTSAGYSDIFVSKLDSSGNFKWAKAIGGTGSDGGQSIAVNITGNVYLAGDYDSPTITFGTTTLTNANNIGNTSDIFIAKLDNTITGIETVEKNNNGISVFPNPSNNYFTITLGNINKKVEVTITDITGKIIYATTATETQIEINTEDFAEGIYVVRIQTADFIETKKLIVTK